MNNNKDKRIQTIPSNQYDAFVKKFVDTVEINYNPTSKNFIFSFSQVLNPLTHLVLSHFIIPEDLAEKIANNILEQINKNNNVELPISK